VWIVKKVLLMVYVILSMLIYDKTEAATTIIYDTDVTRVLGINGLDLSTLGTWNVDFKYGTYTGIFGTSFDFNGAVDAQLVTSAMAAVLNTDSGLLMVTDGGVPGSTFALVPYQTNGPSIDTLAVIKSAGAWQSPSQVYTQNIGTETWYAKATAVPVPGAFWLLGSGLIGTVGIRKKFKK
jgi:PEP-CTERM motif